MDIVSRKNIGVFIAILVSLYSIQISHYQKPFETNEILSDAFVSGMISQASFSSLADVLVDDNRVIHVYCDSPFVIKNPTQCKGSIENFDAFTDVTLEYKGRIAFEFSKLRNNTLFFAFTHVMENLSRNIIQQRAQSPYPFHGIGVMVIGDELNRNSSLFLGAFDYAIRNYYLKNLKDAQFINLRALGNISCGSNDQFPPVRKSLDSPDTWKQPLSKVLHREPRLGTYWKHVGSYYKPLPRSTLIPASERKFAFCFVGSLRSDRRKMVNAFRHVFSAMSLRDPRIRTDPISGLTAFIGLEDDFRGTMEEFEYYHYVISNCAMSLTPKGNNAETIRFADSLYAGAIPIMKDQETYYFRSKFFTPPPVITMRKWSNKSVKMLIKIYKNSTRLNLLQQKGSEWIKRLHECQRNDLVYLIRS